MKLRLSLFIVVALMLATSAVSFAQTHSIVIVAPHPDDEALITSGVIANAKARGDSVKIVVVTNGDAAGPADVREAETVAAMAVLGVPESDIIFLGYGDASLIAMYQAATDDTVIPSAAGRTQTYAYRGLGGTDYHSYIYGTPASYTRRNVIGDLEGVISALHPDDVYTTTVYDTHADHSSTYAFLVHALIALGKQGTTLPKLHEGLIHAFCVTPCDPNYTWPNPTFTPRVPFSQPSYLTSTPYEWDRIENLPVPASMQDANRESNVKYRVIASYPSQDSDWLFAFTKKNEFFWLRDLSTNLAYFATVSASTEAEGTGQGAARAVDGVIAGYPQFDYGEWSTVHEIGGAWIRLAWGAPVSVSRIVLHDRPNLGDNILSGTLSFSDGTAIPVGALPSNGVGLEVTFEPKSIQWVQFRVDSGTGTNVGLAEFEVFPPAATSEANRLPTILRGPTATPQSIATTSTSNLSVQATDLDQDPLQYVWTADTGVVAGSGSNAVFTPPYTTSEFVSTVHVEVNDGRGAPVPNNTFVTTSPVLTALTISPASVPSGGSATGTVTMAIAAPAGGAVVTLVNSDPTVASVPPSVVVPAGATTATFAITSAPLSSAASIKVIGTYAAGTQSAGLSLTPTFITIQSLTVDPTSVASGGTATGTVTLSDAAPADITVALASTNTAIAVVPASVVVALGSTTATFTVNTGTVLNTASATISGTYNGNTRSAGLLVGSNYFGPNLASAATVTVSSENTATGQLGIRAVDGIVDGYPGDYTKEWATVGQLASAWITLTWSNPVFVSEVVLFDRPNANDNITSGTLLFSDGTTESVSTLPNGGAGMDLRFTGRTISSLTFRIDGAVGENIGLAEIGVFGTSVGGVASLTITPTSIGGGSVATGTVTLSAAAGSSGTVVALTSTNPAIAQVQASVTIAAGVASTTFSVNTTGVPASTSVTISATADGATRTAALLVLPPALTSLVLNPTAVSGGNSSTGTVTLNSPAPGAGLIVSLSSSNAGLVQVPATVVVPAGTSSVNFTVLTTVTSAPISVTVTATLNDNQQTATLTLNAPAATGLTLTPSSVTGGASSIGTISLNAAAAAPGVVVALSSADPSVATVPASVTIATGATSATFTVTTVAVAGSTRVVISADANGATQTATLTVEPPTLASLTLNPNTVAGGISSNGIVTLATAAPAGGVVIALTSSNPSAVNVPATVTVPANSLTATFTAMTVPLPDSATVTISGTSNGITRTATLSVTAVTLSAFASSPTSIVGGRTSTATVTLTSVAPSGGSTLTISSSNTAVAQVPATLTIASGVASATFTVTTSPVASNTSAAITVRLGTASRTVTLTVAAPALASMSLNPTAVTGGNSSTGTVTLTGVAARNIVVTLSSNRSSARPPSTVTVPTGASSATFTITTTPVSSNTSANIGASYNGARYNHQLSINAPAVTSLTLNPTTVRGGTSSTGSVTLTGRAPTGGISVSLSSSSTTVATVPSSVTVASGATTANFTVSTRTRTNQATATITASRNGSRTAVITVTP